MGCLALFALAGFGISMAVFAGSVLAYAVAFVTFMGMYIAALMAYFLAFVFFLF